MLIQPTYIHTDNERIPSAESPYHCSLDMQIRFCDIDVLGHVNNNALMAMFDLAKVDYFSCISGGKGSIADIRAAVVNVSCDFYAPVFFTDRFRIFTAITRVGKRSFTVEQRGVAVGDDVLCTKCRCVTILAGYDPATAGVAEIDPELVAMAEAFEHKSLR